MKLYQLQETNYDAEKGNIEAEITVYKYKHLAKWKLKDLKDEFLDKWGEYCDIEVNDDWEDNGVDSFKGTFDDGSYYDLVIFEMEVDD